MERIKIIDLEKDISSLQERVESQLTRGFKKSNGVYFTPNVIIQRLINLAEINIKDKVLDPSCAIGQFLEPIVDRLVLKYKEQKLQNTEIAEVISRSIYGTDINEEFVKLCKKHISKRIYGKIKTKARIKTSNKDFLCMEQKELFDVVIGNPPYGIPGYDPHYPIRLTREQKERYKKKFKTWKGKYNIYALFIEQGLNILKKGGRLAFIVPGTFMILNDFEKLRKYFSIIGKIEIEYLGNNVFKDAKVATVLLKITKRGKGLTLKSVDYYNEIKNYKGDLIRFEDGFTRELEKNAPYTLGELFDIHISARSPEVKKNPFVIKTLNGEQRRGWSSKKTESKEVIPKKEPKGYRPILNGRNLKPFKIDYKINYSGYWIKANKVGTLRDYYLENRIAIGHTKGGKIVAAINTKKYPWISDVYFIIPKKDSCLFSMNRKPLKLEEITYILNSQLAQKLMKRLYRDITPHTTLTQLKIFPIYSKEEWIKLEERYGVK